MDKLPILSMDISRTINLGNFESLRVQVGLEEVKAPDEFHSQGYERIFKILQANLEQAIEASLNKIKNKDEEGPDIKRPSTSRFRTPTVPE